MWVCMWCGRAGRCPCAPARRKGLAAPSLLAISHPGFVTMGDALPGHTLHGGRLFTRVSDCVRARRCTCVHPGRHLGSTRQRRVPALHRREQMRAMWTPRQRRGSRAFLHRGRPGGLGACNLCWREETAAARARLPSPSVRGAARQHRPRRAAARVTPCSASSVGRQQQVRLHAPQGPAREGQTLDRRPRFRGFSLQCRAPVSSSERSVLRSGQKCLRIGGPH
jgi:hypothetical protein